MGLAGCQRKSTILIFLLGDIFFASAITLVALIAVQDIIIIFKHFSSQDILIRDRTFSDFGDFGENCLILVEIQSEKMKNIRKGQKRSQNLPKYLYRTIIEKELISLQDAY